MTSRRKDQQDNEPQSQSQPGPTFENPNGDADSPGSHGDAPAPSTGNQQGGQTPGDTSGAPAGPSGPNS